MRHIRNPLRPAQFQPMMFFQPRRSTDVGRTSVGYRPHAVWSAWSPMPDAFAVTTLNV